MSSRGARITYPIHSDEDAIKTTSKWHRFIPSKSKSQKDHLIMIPEIPRREVAYDYIGNHQ